MNFIKNKLDEVADKAGETVSEVRTGINEIEVPTSLDELKRKIQELKDEKVRMIEEWKAEKEKEFKMFIQSKLERLYDHVMNVVQEHIKEGAKDEDMPDCVANFVDELVDSIWPDIKMEVKDKILSGMSPAIVIEHGEPPASCFGWIPAKIRYTMFPYDKSIWGTMRNPFWWIFMILSLVPKYGIGQITYILLFFFIDCSDEFQLFQYIVDFKSLQFVTLGVLSAIIGAVQYYFCITKDPPNCDKFAPQEELWSIAIFISQVVIIWVAFVLMRNSKKKGGAHYQLTQESKLAQQNTCHTAEQRKNAINTISTSDEILTTMAVENEQVLLERSRKRMLGYLIYDAVCFIVCLGLGLWMAFANLLDRDADVDVNDADTVKSGTNWKFVATLYWIKALYGMLSFPFSLLKIPVITAFMSHAKPTGYNPYGHTVPLLEKKENGPVPWDPTRPVRENV